ncbi:MAG: HK97 family phage prohead protease [Promicromonosporaceae bacterium]|nr:HK97 family phage prohead protease [Promicromonosporaceae bacterium]
METTFIEFDQLEVRDADGHHELYGVCVPYGVETRKAPTARPERFRFGAFAAAIAAAAKIRLTDENHAAGRRPVGVATQLEERRDGLHGRFRFYETDEGRNAYANVLEQTYGGLSIGFACVKDAVVAGVREVQEARLFHVSLVDEPAYEAAQIVSVRSAAEYAEAMHFERPAWVDEVDDTSYSLRVRRLLH